MSIRTSGRAVRRLAVAVAASVLVLSGCAAADVGAAPVAPPPVATSTPAPVPSEEPEAAPSPTFEPLPVGAPPSRVNIPAIDIDEHLIDLGLQPNGTMEVPVDFDEAGWYTGGGMPGGAGPTVIAGHVDSSAGPAVFSRLTELVVGDRVEVTDVNGEVFTYEVYRVEDVAKDDFPTAAVFGALPHDELRLITCTGLFDTSVSSYVDNRVVWAAPVEA